MSGRRRFRIKKKMVNYFALETLDAQTHACNNFKFRLLVLLGSVINVERESKVNQYPIVA